MCFPSEKQASAISEVVYDGHDASLAVLLSLLQDGLGHVRRAVGAAHVGRAHLTFYHDLCQPRFQSIGVGVKAGGGGVVKAVEVVRYWERLYQRWAIHLLKSIWRRTQCGAASAPRTTASQWGSPCSGAPAQPQSGALPVSKWMICKVTWLVEVARGAEMETMDGQRELGAGSLLDVRAQRRQNRGQS